MRQGKEGQGKVGDWHFVKISCRWHACRGRTVAPDGGIFIEMVGCIGAEKPVFYFRATWTEVGTDLTGTADVERLRDIFLPDEIHARKNAGHRPHQAFAIYPFVRGDGENLAVLSVEGGES